MNVNILEEHSDLPYSDGQESERRLLEILKEVKDKGTYSEELSSRVTNWVEEYHFSKKRHLAIKHFNIKKGDRVLELGSGCGSITRYLAEIGAEVISVEGTLARAMVNGERCRGYSNVNIYVDNILNFEVDKSFDWVLLIGVLEYSTKYINSKSPESIYIDKAKDFLDDNGSLIIAIENKLGIKYFNGAEEDHNGKQFYGVENLYVNGDVTTWGYCELKNILQSSGFKDIVFYGVFPDYKLPQVIFTELIDDSFYFRPEELLHYIKSHDYSRPTQRNFEESLVAKSLRSNNCLFKFSNSFIIQCRNSVKFEDNTLLSKYYSVSRLFDFCVETSFYNLNGCDILVEKKLLSKTNEKTAKKISIKIDNERSMIVSQRILNNSSYIKGIHMGYLFTVEQRRSNAGGVEKILDAWAKYLSDNFKFFDKDGKAIELNSMSSYSISEIYIDGASIDCGLHNLIIDNDVIYPFDLEWISENIVPFIWVGCRNISIAMRYDHGVYPKMNFKDVCDYFFSAFGLAISKDDINFSTLIEINFGEKISRKERSDNIPII